MEEVEGGEDPLVRRTGAGGACDELRVESVRAPPQHRLGQLVLRGIEAIQALQRHPRGVADRVHADRPDAVLVEQPVGGVEDLPWAVSSSIRDPVLA